MLEKAQRVAIVRQKPHGGVEVARDRLLRCHFRSSKSAPAPFRDTLIAATAMVHGMKVVTRDTRGFERVKGLQVLSP